MYVCVVETQYHMHQSSSFPLLLLFPSVTLFLLPSLPFYSPISHVYFFERWPTCCAPTIHKGFAQSPDIDVYTFHSCRYIYILEREFCFPHSSGNLSLRVRFKHFNNTASSRSAAQVYDGVCFDVTLLHPCESSTRSHSV